MRQAPLGRRAYGRAVRCPVTRGRGQALVEFGLVLPVLLLMFLGLVDFGRAFFAGVIAEQVAREGARLAAGSAPGDNVYDGQTHLCPAGAPPGCATIKDQVKSSLGFGCASCLDLQALTGGDPTVKVGGYLNDGSTFGCYEGAPSSCTTDTCQS